MAHVRDRPSLAESIEIITPSGNRHRWASDEYQAANRPSAERWSDTMPGGFETHDATLPRKPEIDYSDLERLSTITRYDASGGIIWQGRLERAPRVSGDQIAISPSAVGWQAHLADDRSVIAHYIDQDMSRWHEPPMNRRVRLANVLTAPQGKIPNTIGSGGISWEPPNENIPTGEVSEVHYDAGSGQEIGRLEYKGRRSGAFTNFEAATIFVDAANDDLSGATSEALTLDDTHRIATTFTDGRYAMLRARVTATTTPAAGHLQSYDRLILIGVSGATIVNAGGAAVGVLASSVVADAVSRFAPLLVVNDDSVETSTFAIPHLIFLEPTTVGEIIRQATRFGLEDWAVWDDKEFVWHTRGARGRSWRARVGPAQLEETGPQVDRLWESVIVRYQDVDGTTRTVGPVGSGADTETDDLKDDDPENPANKVGFTRRDLLTMGVGTAASATEVGRRFLEETKQLDSSGRARIVGHVQDDRGVWHPYSHVRAGDTISFVDASDTSYRRIVKTDKTRDDRSCGIDLDAPPEGLQALLERLGVALVPLGL